MKKLKPIAIALSIILSLFVAYSIGYHNAILDAELIEVGNTYYLIDFNGQVHEYE